jgi:cation:H+ antiporter
VIGANILNILVVLGIGSILADGLYFSPENFYLQFPSLLLIVLIFLAFIFNSNKHQISKKEGTVLIMSYAIYILASLFLL